MGMMAYSLLWAMQDLYHQPYPSQSLGLPTPNLALGLPAALTLGTNARGTELLSENLKTSTKPTSTEPSKRPEKKTRKAGTPENVQRCAKMRKIKNSKGRNARKVQQNAKSADKRQKSKHPQCTEKFEKRRNKCGKSNTFRLLGSSRFNSVLCLLKPTPACILGRV